MRHFGDIKATLYTLSVSWKHDNEEWTTTETNANGVFRFENLDGSSTWPDDRNLPTGSASIYSYDNAYGCYWSNMDFNISESDSNLTVDVQMNPPFSECGGGMY